MIVGNKNERITHPQNGREPSVCARFGGNSYRAFFYKHETTFRGLKTQEIEN